MQFYSILNIENKIDRLKIKIPAIFRISEKLQEFVVCIRLCGALFFQPFVQPSEESTLP